MEPYGILLKELNDFYNKCYIHNYKFATLTYINFSNLGETTLESRNIFLENILIDNNILVLGPSIIKNNEPNENLAELVIHPKKNYGILLVTGETGMLNEKIMDRTKEYLDTLKGKKGILELHKIAHLYWLSNTYPQIIEERMKEVVND